MAHDLAKATGASVVVFHVSRPPAVVSDGDRLHVGGGRCRGEADVWDELRKIQAKDPAVRVEHEVIVADRPDAKHILRILQERGCDLIVMGTHGDRGGDCLHRLFGSVTEDVVRTGPLSGDGRRGSLPTRPGLPARADVPIGRHVEGQRS